MVAVAAIMVAYFLIAATMTPRAVGVSGMAMTSARAMATVEVTSGRLLYSKNADARVPMASTTKIVTAITVLEHVDDIDTVVAVHPRAIGIEGTSIYIQRGEKLTVRELLLGLMLRSGNDCASALAWHVGGSIEKFAAMMNDVSRKAGARNSNWVNPHGLDAEGHLTTAHDLALISAYAMRNPTFAEIVATKEARITGVDMPRVLLNKNRLLRSNEDIVGVKTGFTSKAGRCFVGALNDNGMTVVCVVLNCGPMFPESESIMERAVDEFYMHKILSRDEVIIDRGGRRGMVADDFLYPLRNGEVDSVRVELGQSEVLVTRADQLIHRAKYLVLAED